MGWVTGFLLGRRKRLPQRLLAAQQQHADVIARDAERLCDLVVTRLVVVREHDRQAVLFRQRGQRGAHLVAALVDHQCIDAFDRLGLRRREFGRLVAEAQFAVAAPPQQIDAVIARDADHPRRKRLRRVVAVERRDKPARMRLAPRLQPARCLRAAEGTGRTPGRSSCGIPLRSRPSTRSLRHTHVRPEITVVTWIYARGGGKLQGSPGHPTTPPSRRTSVGRFGPCRHPREIGARHLLRVELLRCGAHPQQRLRHRHRRRGVALLRLVEAHRVDARDDVVAQIRRAQPCACSFATMRFTSPSISSSRAAQPSRSRRLAGSGLSPKRSTFLQERAVRAAREARRRARRRCRASAAPALRTPPHSPTRACAVASSRGCAPCGSPRGSCPSGCAPSRC